MVEELAPRDYWELAMDHKMCRHRRECVFRRWGTFAEQVRWKRGVEFAREEVKAAEERVVEMCAVEADVEREMEREADCDSALGDVGMDDIVVERGACFVFRNACGRLLGFDDESVITATSEDWSDLQFDTGVISWDDDSHFGSDDGLDEVSVVDSAGVESEWSDI